MSEWCEVVISFEYDNMGQRKAILQALMWATGDSMKTFSFTVADEPEDDDPIDVSKAWPVGSRPARKEPAE